MSYPELLSPEEKLASAKERLALPEIVVLCGSTAFMAEFAEANLQQTAAGRIVLSVGCNMKSPHPLWADPVEAELLKVRLDGLHKAKIRLADWVLVVGTRVGDSTRSEIAYALSLGKPVRFVDASVAAEFDGEVA
jgi:thiamine pyrophosphate-dependent acetolactate synthase large subunit-like protein